jgi:hypothetical protein
VPLWCNIFPDQWQLYANLLIAAMLRCVSVFFLFSVTSATSAVKSFFCFSIVLLLGVISKCRFLRIRQLLSPGAPVL